MKIKDVMTQQPEYLDADTTIREVAERMHQNNSGFEPIVQDDKIIGTLTDRDIMIQAVAQGKDLDEKASSIATTEVLYTFEDADVKDALKDMQEQRVQRLIVLDNESDKNLAGVVTLGDIANHCQDDEIAREVANCSKHY